MQKIIPHLWFDKQAEEAVEFYASTFTNSKVGNKTYYTEAGFEVHGMPAGLVMTAALELEDLRFIALNGGPIFKFNPSISFLVACDSKEEVDKLWDKLSEGGMVLMELGSYPFSEHYGWTQDKYGLSWQIMYTTEIVKQKITPTLMFVGDVAGKAKEAIELYTSTFDNSKIGDIMTYGPGEEPDKDGTYKHAAFTLEGQEFAAMDSAHEHKFNFSEAISLLVNCETQEEIDRYWDKLSEGGDSAAQQCGWLKDRFGVSWQIAPTVLNKMINDPDKEKAERVTNAFLKMKKFDIEALKKAYEG